MKKKSLPKSWKGRITAAILGVTLSFTAFTGSVVLAAPEIPVDTSGVDNYDGGRLPAGLDSSYYTLPQDTNAITPRGVTLPKRYDLRDKGLVTGTRNQNPWGACWSFGNTSSIESNAVLKGAGSAGSLDYSEHYMAWFTFQPYQGEGYEIVEGAANVLDFGGRRQMATADTTAWFGPINETEAPFTNAAGTLDKTGDWSLPESLRDEAEEVHVQNVDYLPETGVFKDTAVDKDGSTYKTGYSFDEAALKAVKSALVENGVLDVSYYADKSLPSQPGEPATEIFNGTTHAQYSPKNVAANHEVSIVGWNDDYSADHFATKPVDENGNPLNGAWIVKNSWGPGKGGPDWVDEDGYFYISYYDQTISEFTSYQVDVPENGLFAYDNNYQYDFLGYKSFVSVPPSEDNRGNKIANIFTAEKDEVLTAVSAITVDTNSTVEIEIYKLADGADLSNAGEAVSTITAQPTYGGYHTIALNKDVELKAGERFAVVETITGDRGGYLPIEMGYSGVIPQGGGGQVKSVAKIEPGQSYVFSKENGQWIWSDIADTPPTVVGDETSNYGNAMIKAFTVDQDDAVAAALTVESLDSQKQSQGSQEVTDFAAPVLLPAGTETIRLSATAQNGTASLSVAENTEIAKEDFQNTPIVLSLTSEPRGNNGAEYTLSFNIEKVLVSEDGSTTLIDNQELLPEGTIFDAKALTKGDAYEQAKKTLKDGHDAFTLYEVTTLDKDNKPVTLASGKNMTMEFRLPDGYEAAKTKIYTIGDDGRLKDMNAAAKTPEPQATVLRTAEAAESKTVLSVDTNVLNGIYAIAVVKNDTSGGTDEPQQGSGGTETKYAEAPAQPGVLTGLTSAANIVLPIGIIVLVIVIAGVWIYLRRKNK